MELMTVREVAEILRVDETTLRRWIVAGTMPAVKLPHKGKRTQYRIKRSEIDKMLGVGDEHR